MRKILFFAAVALLGLTTTHAQVKLGFGLGYAIPSGDISDFTDGGISGHFELGYGVTEDIDVSVLLHGDFLSSKDVGAISYQGLALGSLMVNGRYYFKKEGFRPYGSLGIGFAEIGSLEVNTLGTTVVGTERTTNFSFSPAVGFKYGVLNVNAAYLNAGKIGEGDGKATVSDISLNVGLLFTFGGK
ncbi:outer membrane beta-barrel protein [Aquimarina sediminis]|uniref:outer membrane beta-barrel protein n=1 Tax=Aquimarina sediminis TaxID=2070536 RepID=UPI000C9FFE98|nr:outer membrane beta-barrel protein [Aquimarina sediminis]